MRRKYYILLIVLISSIFIFKPSVYAIELSYEVDFINLAQSDCTLIKSEDRNYLIDTGSIGKADKTLDYLNKADINYIDTIVITHYHDDHYGGLKEILDNKKVNRVLLPSHRNEKNEELYNYIKNKGVEVQYVNKSTKLQYKKMNLSFITPKKEDKLCENNNSLVLFGAIDGVKYIFMGDSQKEEEKYIAKCKGVENCDIIKIPHHGLNTSSTKAILKTTNAKVAVINCDGIESPSNSVIKRLDSLGISIYRTDRNGTIIVK